MTEGWELGRGREEGLLREARRQTEEREGWDIQLRERIAFQGF